MAAIGDVSFSILAQVGEFAGTKLNAHNITCFSSAPLGPDFTGDLVLDLNYFNLCALFTNAALMSMEEGDVGPCTLCLLEDRSRLLLGERACVSRKVMMNSIKRHLYYVQVAKIRRRTQPKKAKIPFSMEMLKECDVAIEATFKYNGKNNGRTAEKSFDYVFSCNVWCCTGIQQKTE